FHHLRTFMSCRKKRRRSFIFKLYLYFLSDRVYLQFSLDHLLILSPSVTMVTTLRLKGEESGSDVTHRKRRVEEESGVGINKRRPDEQVSSSVAMSTVPEGGASQAFVSMVIKVKHKGGVAWRNTGIWTNGGEEGLQLEFSITALVIGPVVGWGRDPMNGPMMKREVEPKREEKVRNSLPVVYLQNCTAVFC
ncbi:hypothetical protein XENOCAPTIV_019310, partial [Xenoophorus captivus]